jgi:hypothetical protein
MDAESDFLTEVTMEATEKERESVRTEKGKEIVFFIDKQQFKTEQTELTVRVLLADYAKDDPSQTTLVLKQGNDLTKYTNLDEVIHLENGMKFLVYHNTPTPVSGHVRS